MPTHLYPLHRYDDSYRLKISPLLWLVFLYALRHGLCVAIAHLPGKEDWLGAWGFWQGNSILLLSDAVTFFVLWLAGNRTPEAPTVLRWLWHRGRDLLRIGYLLDLALGGFLWYSKLLDPSDMDFLEVWSILAVDLLVLVFLTRSILIRDIFADFPEQEDLVPRKDPKAVIRFRQNSGRGILVRYPEASDDEAPFREALERNMDDASAWHALGIFALQAANLEKATDCVRHATLIEGSNPIYLRNLCEMCRRLGQLDEAAKVGLAATRLSPNDADAHYNLGLVWSQAGRGQDAINSYRGALMLNPNHAYARNNLALLLNSMGKENEILQI